MTADVFVDRRDAPLRLLCAALAGFLVVASISPDVCAAGASAPTAPVPQVDVTMQEGRFSVAVANADLQAVLRQISALAKVPIEVDPAIKAVVTATFGGVPLDEAVRRLVRSAGEGNLATEFSRRPGARGEMAVQKITVVRSAPQRRRPLEEIAAEVAQRDREHREYYDAMDRDGNKIARALKKRLDPATSNEEKAKLKDYLRKTSVDDPEDKKVLKAALMDSRFKGDVVSDLQMALMRAIQDHPEESDKEYILQLLERRDNRVGWMYYAMPEVWDERYVPYLIENVIREHGFTSYEILGRMKVKEAVPFLKVALKSDSPRVRLKAQHALLGITGERFPIE